MERSTTYDHDCKRKNNNTYPINETLANKTEIASYKNQ